MSLAPLIALASLPPAWANIILGDVTSTAACYDALRSSRLPGEERVDKEGYVNFVNELSDSALAAFQEGPSGEWGYFPVTSFDRLPPAMRGEFYRHACGGPHVICENAYLYTEGIDAEASAQQEVYLFRVCVGVENAIEETARSGLVNIGRNPFPEGKPTAQSAEDTIVGLRKRESGAADEDGERGGEKSMVGAIAGSAIVGCLVALGMIFFAYRRFRSRANSKGEEYT
ncbi:hypothetical protein ACHAWF_013981 [Thalassiosira exigua]